MLKHARGRASRAATRDPAFVSPTGRPALASFDVLPGGQRPGQGVLELIDFRHVATCKATAIPTTHPWVIKGLHEIGACRSTEVVQAAQDLCSSNEGTGLRADRSAGCGG